MKINFEVEANEMMKFFEFLSVYAASEKERNEANAQAEKERKDTETRKEIIMTALREGIKS